MDLLEAIQIRRSIRAFMPTLVSREVLANILEQARQAPSATNCQPWEFIVLTGESLLKAKQVNIDQAQSGAPVAPDFQTLPPNYLVSPYVDRQNALARAMFHSLGISRSDREKRSQWQLKGKRFFDAPAAILVCADDAVLSKAHQIPLIDIGLVTQTIALAALEYELGTCIQQDTIFFAQALKSALDIPESKRLILAIAIGYPDWGHPVNQFPRDREPLEKLVVWKS